jgi:hypothetical protein
MKNRPFTIINETRHVYYMIDAAEPLEALTVAIGARRAKRLRLSVASYRELPGCVTWTAGRARRWQISQPLSLPAKRGALFSAAR